MEFLNDIYEKEELFYWCNCCCDVNMPGDSSFSIHSPDELPPRYYELYEKYQTEDSGCYRYVVSFRGHPGMLLVALHDDGYYDDILSKKEPMAFKKEILMKECARKFTALLVLNQCEKMSKDKRLDGCVSIFGENTDPDGHELALFIPEEAAFNIDKFQEVFLEYCWTKEDEKCLNLVKGLIWRYL